MSKLEQALKYTGHPQPMPAGGDIDVAADAAGELLKMGQNEIATDIETRICIGMKKYGSRLKAHNGRNAWRDAYDQSLNAINYGRQAQIEGLDSGGLFRHAVELAIYIHDRFDTKDSKEHNYDTKTGN